MYKLYIYDVVKGFSRLIDENVSEADIPRIKRKYGSNSVVVDGTDIIVMRTRL